jgi:hypothetical protein
MKTKTRSKQAVKHSDAVPKKSAAEERLQAIMQRLRSNPSYIVGALIIIYCVLRLVFSA